MFERFRKETQCYRLSPGVDNPDGSFTEGGRTGFTIKCSKQPATADELLSLPEGRRSRESYVLYYETDDPLQTVETSETRNPDIVEIFGEEYECAETGKWRNDVINHWRSIVQRLQPASGCVYTQQDPVVASFNIEGAVEEVPGVWAIYPETEPPWTVQFTDTSNGDPTSWEWDFGDGGPTDDLQNPTRQFVIPEVQFTIQLTASKSGSSDVTTKDLIIFGATPR